MELALFLIAMLAFWLFIRIDRRRANDARASALPRERLIGGFTPGLAGAWIPYAACLALCIMGAVFFALHPTSPPFDGRWSVVNAAVYGALGAYGMSYIYTLGAVLTAAHALRKFQEGSAQRGTEDAA